MATTISIVIPNWNGAARLRRLLDSLQRQTERACEVLVVDNASGDDSRSAAEAFGATFMALDRNYGFTRAVNTGVRLARGQAVGILNNDVTVAPDYLERLGGALKDYSFATPKIVMSSDPSRLDGTFDLTSRGFCSWRAGYGFAAGSRVWNERREIVSAPMTASVFQKSVFDQVGLLDEQFGSYLEDVDFGIRCAVKGVKGVYEPAAVATHEGSATLGGAWNAASVKWISRNQALLAKKYDAGWSWPVWVGQGLWGLAAFKKGMGRAWIQGKIEGYRLKVESFESGASARLEPILNLQEQQIRNLLIESATHETYWSAYMALTRAGR